jgi:hypothetical protein
MILHIKMPDETGKREKQPYTEAGQVFIAEKE